MLFFLGCISITAIYIDFTYSDWEYMCGEWSLLVSGIYQLFILTTLTVTCWKFYVATFDLSEFALNKNLPSE